MDSLTWLGHLDNVVNFGANLLTIIASLIVIILFVKNYGKISSVFNLLLNYSMQLTLSELKYKIERLNDFSANDPVQKEEIINIIHDIQGQINGNKTLKENLAEQLLKINNYIATPRALTEPKKRSLISELRERVRNVVISNYKELVESKTEN